MVANQLIENSTVTNSHIEELINNIIGDLQVDRMMFQNDAVSKETREHYEVLASQDDNKMNEYVLNQSRKHFVTKMLVDLMTEINKLPNTPNKIALNVNLANSKINVWVEIKDDDEITEHTLYMIEASVNARYEQYGFYASLIIVEESDKINVPVKYRIYPITSN